MFENDKDNIIRKHNEDAARVADVHAIKLNWWRTGQCYSGRVFWFFLTFLPTFTMPIAGWSTVHGAVYAGKYMLLFPVFCYLHFRYLQKSQYYEAIRRLNHEGLYR